MILTDVVLDLVGVSRMIMIRASGSIICFGTQSIRRALISPRQPLHGFSETLWGPTVRDVHFLGLVPHFPLFGVSPRCPRSPWAIVS